MNTIVGAGEDASAVKMGHPNPLKGTWTYDLQTWWEDTVN